MRYNVEPTSFIFEINENPKYWLPFLKESSGELHDQKKFPVYEFGVVSNWVKEHLNLWPEPVDYRNWRLQPFTVGRPFRNHHADYSESNEAHIQPVYVFNNENKENRQDPIWLPSLVSFEWVFLGDKRVEVSANVWAFELRDIVDSWLLELAKRYPEVTDRLRKAPSAMQADVLKEYEAAGEPNQDNSIPRPSRPMPDDLTECDKTIWQEYVAGARVEVIAQNKKVSLSSGTVSNHLTKLFEKGLVPRNEQHWKRRNS